MSVVAGQTLRIIKPIEPFCERTKCNGMTFGVGPAGYDVRIDCGVTIFSGCFALAATLEHFTMPNDLIAYVKDKSTWARQGLAVQNTVIEPGWRGFLTLELTNHSHTPIKIMSGDPIAQIVFHRLETPTNMPYAGKYQDQRAGAQPAIIEHGMLPFGAGNEVD